MLGGGSPSLFFPFLLLFCQPSTTIAEINNAGIAFFLSYLTEHSKENHEFKCLNLVVTPLLEAR